MKFLAKKVKEVKETVDLIRYLLNTKTLFQFILE